MKDKHKIIISGKWHRVCLSPSLKIQQEEIDFFLEKFVNEFKILSNKWVPNFFNKIKGKASF